MLTNSIKRSTTGVGRKKKISRVSKFSKKTKCNLSELYCKAKHFFDGKRFLTTES
jgi:hypothetical protein